MASPPRSTTPICTASRASTILRPLAWKICSLLPPWLSSNGPSASPCNLPGRRSGCDGSISGATPAGSPSSSKKCCQKDQIALDKSIICDILYPVDNCVWSAGACPRFFSSGAEKASPHFLHLQGSPSRIKQLQNAKSVNPFF